MKEVERIQAVIFDLDGLMIDSEPISLRIWQEFLKKYDKELTDVDYRRIIGMEGKASAAYIRERMGIPLDVEAIRVDHWRELIQAMKAEAKPKDGLMELVDAFQTHDLPLAVASNSPSAYVEAALDTIGLRGVFQFVVAADQVARGKPAPDIYLAAAEGLGKDPGSCLAIEDSLIGMQSAVNAGMRCMVVSNPDLEGTAFEGAHGVFDSLRSLLAALDDLFEARI